MLRLTWLFRNDQREFHACKLKPKSTFDARSKDTTIEIYLGSLEVNLMSTDIPNDNITRQEQRTSFITRPWLLKGLIISRQW